MNSSAIGLLNEGPLHAALKARYTQQGDATEVCLDGYVIDIVQVDQHTFNQPTDFVTLLPTTLPKPFTTAHLATAARIPRRLAQQMAYCLRQLELILAVGKVGNALLYDHASG